MMNQLVTRWANPDNPQRFVVILVVSNYFLLLAVANLATRWPRHFTLIDVVLENSMCVVHIHVRVTITVIHPFQPFLVLKIVLTIVFLYPYPVPLAVNICDLSATLLTH